MEAQWIKRAIFKKKKQLILNFKRSIINVERLNLIKYIKNKLTKEHEGGLGIIELCLFSGPKAKNEKLYFKERYGVPFFLPTYSTISRIFLLNKKLNTPPIPNTSP